MEGAIPQNEEAPPQEVPEFQYDQVMTDPDKMTLLQQSLGQGGFGAAVIRNVVEGEDLAKMQTDFRETIVCSSPHVDKSGNMLKRNWHDMKEGPPGSRGSSIASSCGYPQSKVAWDMRKHVRPLFGALYNNGNDEYPMCASMDALLFVKGAKGQTSLKPHYDYSEDPESPAQRVRTMLMREAYNRFLVAMKVWSHHKDSPGIAERVFHIVVETRGVDELLRELESNHGDLLQELSAVGLQVTQHGAWTDEGRLYFEDAVKAVQSEITDAVQGILTLMSTEGVGTVFDTSTLYEDKSRREKRCGRQGAEEPKGSRQSCFRVLTPEDARGRLWSAPQGGPGDLVLWNSRKAHTNALPKDADRQGAAVAWLPDYTDSHDADKRRKKKKIQVEQGGGTNHWATECVKNGAPNSQCNSPKHPHMYWKVGNQHRVLLPDVSRHL